MKWLSYWSLSEPPFSKDITDQNLWVPSSRKRIVDSLVEACHERSHALLVGEPGVGKTCVLRALRHQLPQAGFRLTYCHNATLGRRDFYRHLCQALDLTPKATAAAVFYAISERVQALSSERVHPVFLLDEAHLLKQDVLEHLHILSNYEWDARPLLSLVLVGLPETQQRLLLAKNRSLWSRIHTRLSIGEAQAKDTAEYIMHRLKHAGTERDIFSSDAIAMLHEASDGQLRELDRIATSCLKLGAKRKLRVIDRDLVAHAKREDDDDTEHH